jgi:hypothetical protein
MIKKKIFFRNLIHKTQKIKPKNHLPLRRQSAKIIKHNNQGGAFF